MRRSRRPYLSPYWDGACRKTSRFRNLAEYPAATKAQSFKEGLSNDSWDPNPYGATQKVGWFDSTSCRFISFHFISFPWQPSACRGMIPRMHRRKWQRWRGSTLALPLLPAHLTDRFEATDLDSLKESLENMAADLKKYGAQKMAMADSNMGQAQKMDHCVYLHRLLQFLAFCKSLKSL